MQSEAEVTILRSSVKMSADPPALPLTGLPQCGLQLQN